MSSAATCRWRRATGVIWLTARRGDHVGRARGRVRLFHPRRELAERRRGAERQCQRRRHRATDGAWHVGLPGDRHAPLHAVGATRADVPRAAVRTALDPQRAMDGRAADHVGPRAQRVRGMLGVESRQVAVDRVPRRPPAGCARRLPWTATDATLSVSGPADLTNGVFSLTDPLGVTFSKSTWTAPVSHDPVTDRLLAAHRRQPGAAHRVDSTTLTFTLSTTTP